jgi:hypothetical protein
MTHFERQKFISFYLRPWPESFAEPLPCSHSPDANDAVAPPSDPSTLGGTPGSDEGAKNVDAGLGLSPAPC